MIECLEMRSQNRNVRLYMCLSQSGREIHSFPLIPGKVATFKLKSQVFEKKIELKKE
jgi:hypothetical protein